MLFMTNSYLLGGKIKVYISKIYPRIKALIEIKMEILL
jgi:hypothetical protein